MFPAMSNTHQSTNRESTDVLSLAELALLLSAVAIGVYLRLEPVGAALLFGDELHTLRTLDKGYAYLLTTNSSTGSGMLLPLVQRVLADGFGLNHWTIRAPAYVGGLGLLVCMYPLGRRLVGARAAVLATLMLAFNSSLIFYSHIGRSYALMAWLGLVLVYNLQRIIDGDGASRHHVYTAMLIGLLPYVHLTSIGLVLTVSVGSMAVLVWEARHREAAKLGLALGLGLVVAALLYAPAFTSLQAFVSEKSSRTYEGTFGVLDVAALLVGSRGGAILSIPLLAVALSFHGWRGRWRSLPLVLACIAPVLAIVLIRPFGGPYAYARYAIAMLPFAFLFLGSLFADPFPDSSNATVSRARPLLGLAGVTFAIALFLLGPGGRGVPDGPHANTYISMFPLPAFDIPWSGGSAFYSQLEQEEGSIRIIEAPALVSRSRHLYRNQYLQHEKETWLALFPYELDTPPDGPYVSLASRGWRTRANADYLILHLKVREEITEYWSFVYDTNRNLANEQNVAAFMERQRRYTWLPKPETLPKLQQSLLEELGEPTYRDEWLWVWDLRKIGGE